MQQGANARQWGRVGRRAVAACARLAGGRGRGQEAVSYRTSVSTGGGDGGGLGCIARAVWSWLRAPTTAATRSAAGIAKAGMSKGPHMVGGAAALCGIDCNPGQRSTGVDGKQCCVAFVGAVQASLWPLLCMRVCVCVRTCVLCSQAACLQGCSAAVALLTWCRQPAGAAWLVLPCCRHHSTTHAAAAF